jgi:hypothetical protein
VQGNATHGRSLGWSLRASQTFNVHLLWRDARAHRQQQLAQAIMGFGGSPSSPAASSFLVVGRARRTCGHVWRQELAADDGWCGYETMAVGHPERQNNRRETGARLATRGVGRQNELENPSGPAAYERLFCTVRESAMHHARRGACPSLAACEWIERERPTRRPLSSSPRTRSTYVRYGKKGGEKERGAEAEQRLLREARHHNRLSRAERARHASLTHLQPPASSPGGSSRLLKRTDPCRVSVDD